MQFFEWMKKQTLITQMMFLEVVMVDVEKCMKGVAENPESFTRQDCKDSGVTQVYRAGEGESDLRFRWNQMKLYLDIMDNLICVIEDRARN